MPVCSQIARVTFTFVAASTKPIGVVEVAWFGLGDALWSLNGAQPVELLGPVVPHTSIGWMTTYSVTGTAACACPPTMSATDNEINHDVPRGRGVHLLIASLPPQSVTSNTPVSSRHA